ncbi:sulfatase-like hydrolase/transferase [Streptomyces sp. NPDC048202]|uniref:sulfatase-like hydrolase/transferase n=1 Tax=Streptomyces sp. NPDC048202 TaxID=3365514 RepID=UPI0037184B7F
MPNVKQLQKDGTSFTDYFVTDSLCCPSRSSILNGKFPHNTGVSNGPPSPRTAPPLPRPATRRSSPASRHPAPPPTTSPPSPPLSGRAAQAPLRRRTAFHRPEVRQAGSAPTTASTWASTGCR